MKRNIFALTGIIIGAGCAIATSGIIGNALENRPSDLAIEKNAPKAELNGYKTFKAGTLPTLDASEVAAHAPKKELSNVKNPYGKYYKEDVEDGHINYWVFECFASSDYFIRGIVHGTTPYSANRDLIKQWGNFEGSVWNSGEDYINSGCMVGDEYWAYVSETWAGGIINKPKGIYTVDLETGKIGRQVYDDSPRYDNNNCVLNEMSYDPKTGYVYGIMKQAKGNFFDLEIFDYMEIVRIDPENADRGWDVLGRIDYSLTMACDDGYMYLCQINWEYTGNQITDIYGEVSEERINRGTNLYKVNLEDLAYISQDDLELVGEVNQGFMKNNYLQTMEFDHSDHTLYWFGAKDDANGTGFITTLDVETAETGDPLMDMLENTQYVAAAIPYELVEADAPHYVRDLSYVTGSEGKGEVELTWTNPTTNSYKNKLNELTSIKIYRDNELRATIDATGMGEKQTWKEEDLTSGFHCYQIVPCNSAGDGLSRYRTVFVGRDLPGAVTNILVRTNGSEATISWTPSTVGANRGWYDKESLKYDVTRLPDNVKIAEGITETSISDKIDTYKGYSYKIVPANVDGVGVEAVSNIYAYGPPVDVPYINDFANEERAYEFTPIDNNHDGNPFVFTASDFVANKWGYDFNLSKPDEWLISPPFNFDSDKEYQIRMQFSTSNYKDTEEKLEVRQGDACTVASQTTLLDTIIGLPTYYGALRTAVISGIKPENGQYLSIHIDSKPNQGWVTINYFEVREYGKKDVSVIDVSGSQMAYIGSENLYMVTVKNEGREAVNGAKAQLIDDAGNVLAESTVPELKVGETQEVEVAWVPANAGKIHVYGHVELEGDTYLADNTYSSYIEVEVGDGEASRWTTVLRRDAQSWVPLYVLLGHSENVTIYYPSEIGKRNIMITGVAYTYAPAENPDAYGLKDVPVSVAVAETTRKVLTDGTNPVTINNLRTRGKAVVDMSGTNEKNDITIMFDTPLKYVGDRNIAFKITADITEPLGDNPHWFVKDEYAETAENVRSTYSNGNKVSYNFYPPVIKVGYRDIDGGEEGVIVLGAKVSVLGNKVTFEKEMDTIEVYDMAGRKVASTAKSASVEIKASGCYVVRGNLGSDSYSAKVVIK